MGRFTQQDPIGLAGGLNLYGYANADPVNFSDPMGTFPLAFAAAAVGDAGVKIAGWFAALSAAAMLHVLREQIAKGAEAAEEFARSCHFVTYTRTHPSTGQVYSGRTQGCGSPEASVQRRAWGHPARLKSFGSPQIDCVIPMLGNSIAEDAVIGREQQLIDANGRAQSENGTSANKIRAYRKYNPFGPVYDWAARQSCPQ
jgi:hypothetical protein